MAISVGLEGPEYGQAGERAGRRASSVAMLGPRGSGR